MGTPKGLEQLKQIMTKMAPIPEDEWQYFGQHLTERTFEKHAYLVRAGDVVRNFYFIISGLVRFFIVRERGKNSISLARITVSRRCFPC